jgi:hypothetical protein
MPIMMRSPPPGRGGVPGGGTRRGARRLAPPGREADYKVGGDEHREDDGDGCAPGVLRQDVQGGRQPESGGDRQGEQDDVAHNEDFLPGRVASIASVPASCCRAWRAFRWPGRCRRNGFVNFMGFAFLVVG